MSIVICLYFLKSDGSVLPFDTKGEEGIPIHPSEFITHYILSYGKFLTCTNMSSRDILVGRERGLLTIVCNFI